MDRELKQYYFLGSLIMILVAFLASWIRFDLQSASNLTAGLTLIMPVSYFLVYLISYL